MRVLGVNGYLASSGRFPDSLWIHRKCRDQMMALKLTQSRKEEDVKHARGHHLQCVLGQTPALEVSAGHLFCCAASPGRLQNLFGSPGSGDPKLCDRTSRLFEWVHGGTHYLSPIWVKKREKDARRNNFKAYASEKNIFHDEEQEKAATFVFVSSVLHLSSSHLLKGQTLNQH